MDTGKARLVEVAQHQVARGGLAAQLRNLGFGGTKSGLISFFLRLARVRFQTKSSLRSRLLIVCACTGVPPASRCRTNSSVALKGTV